MCEWKLIETAPRDGSYILLTSGYIKPPHEFRNMSPNGWIAIGHWARKMRGDGCAWHNAADIWELYPTHWRPLPDPPEN